MRPKSPEVSKKGEKSLWDAAKIFQNVSPLTSPSSSRASSSKKREKCIRRHPIRFMDINVIGNWTLKNIAMAGKLLRKPPIPVQFYDEDEMRKVYSLIYDVFRCKYKSRNLLPIFFSLILQRGHLFRFYIQKKAVIARVRINTELYNFVSY